MAVAEKPATKTLPRNPVQQLALASLAGAVYLIVALGVVLSGIPTLWDHWLGINAAISNDFLSTALVVLVSAGAAVGFFVLGRKLEGPHPLRGQLAGSVIGAAMILLIFIIVMDWIGGPVLVARDVDPMVSWAVLLVLGGGLLFGVYWIYTRPGFAKFLVRVEDNGWFSVKAFKYNQGQLMRRLTLIGLLIVVACGIYSMYFNMRTVGYTRMNWEILLPGTSYSLAVLYNINYTLPVLIFLICGWLAWRLVNLPQFADFLIATEAEMNKVSWTTRKRLVQDTVVVLVTLLFMTVFLFVVDVIWIRVLSFQPVPGVLQIDPQATKQKQMGQADW